MAIIYDMYLSVWRNLEVETTISEKSIFRKTVFSIHCPSLPNIVVHLSWCFFKFGTGKLLNADILETTFDSKCDD